MHFEELLKFKVLYKVLLNTSKKSLKYHKTLLNFYHIIIMHFEELLKFIKVYKKLL